MPKNLYWCISGLFSSSAFRILQGPFAIAVLSLGSGFAQNAEELPDAKRDQTAVATLANALTIDGGSKAWANIHGAKVHGSLTKTIAASSGNSSIVNGIDWVDDWSTGKPRYIRTTIRPSGSTTGRHPDSATSKGSLQGKSIVVPQFDTTSVLLTHLPAVALSMLLTDASYSILDDVRSSSQEDIAVHIVRLQTGCEQIWSISRTTGQVDSVRFTVPDVATSRHATWEVVVYKQYRTDHGLTVPEDVTLIRPSGQSISLHFDTLQLNPLVSANDFLLGGAQ